MDNPMSISLNLKTRKPLERKFKIIENIVRQADKPTQVHRNIYIEENLISLGTTRKVASIGAEIYNKINHEINILKKHRYPNKKRFQNGMFWMRRSIYKWANELNCSMSTIDRALKILKANNLIIINCFNNDPDDRTSWYSINKKVISTITETVLSNPCKIPSHLPDVISIVDRVDPKYINIHKQEIYPNEVVVGFVNEMVKNGVESDACKKMIKKYGFEKILEQCPNFLKQENLKNPTGWLIAAIENQYTMTTSEKQYEKNWENDKLANLNYEPDYTLDKYMEKMKMKEKDKDDDPIIKRGDPYETILAMKQANNGNRTTSNISKELVTKASYHEPWNSNIQEARNKEMDKLIPSNSHWDEMLNNYAKTKGVKIQ
jgi:hypothetical protein